MASKCDYYWEARWNKPRGWRQHVGEWIRRIADRLDGRVSLALDVVTVPFIGSKRLVEAIRYSQSMFSRSINETVKAEAEERVLRALRPDLYRSVGGG